MSRGRFEAEVIVLRHQLNIVRRLLPMRVRPNVFDRAIFVCLYRHSPDICNAVAIIRPETVIQLAPCETACMRSSWTAAKTTA